MDIVVMNVQFLSMMYADFAGLGEILEQSPRWTMKNAQYTEKTAKKSLMLSTTVRKNSYP